MHAVVDENWAFLKDLKFVQRLRTVADVHTGLPRPIFCISINVPSTKSVY